MARLNRVSPVGVPFYILQQGTNRPAIFADDLDMRAYSGGLKNILQTMKWVLMTNHVHMLFTPHVKRDTSLMMQPIGRMYVRYFNYTYQRTGTLRKSQFRSSLVQSDYYLLSLYRYSEMDPICARGMVLLGIVGQVMDVINLEYQAPHEEYLLLGKIKDERQESYKVKVRVGKELRKEIRKSTKRGLALGSSSFTELK